MNKVFTLGFLFLSFFSFAQLSSIPVTIIDDLHAARTNPVSAAFATSPKTCSEDTVQYTYYKGFGGAGYQAIAISNGYSLGQYFDAPDSIEISGVSFYGWNLSGVDTSIEITFNLYLAGVDTLPTGSPVRSVTVSVDTTFQNGILSALYQHAVFSTPYKTDKPYIICAESQDSIRVGIVCNNYANNAGQAENIACGTVGGTWYRCMNLNIGGTTLDCDILLEPHVTYDIYGDFDAPTCYQAADSVVFTNQSSPYLFHRMYNRYETYDAYQGYNYGRFAHRWTFGETFSSYYNDTIQVKHKYNLAGNYNVRLYTTQYGFRNGTGCRDTSDYWVNYMPSTVGYVADTPVCSSNPTTIQVYTNADAYWFTSPTATTEFQVASYLTTPALYNDTTFYVQGVNGDCRSSRAQVYIPVAETPSSLVTTNDSICLNASGNLSATTDFGEITWWDSLTGGSIIANGDVYVSDPLISSVTYYAEANNRGCLGAKRVAATIDVSANNAPADPITNLDSLICLHDGDVMITAVSPSNDAIYWFDVASGGSPLSSGNSFSYSPTQLGIDYVYVEVDNGQCASSRLQKKLNVWNFPSTTIPAGDTLCNGESVVLDFSDQFGSVRWYDDATAGNVLYDSNYFEISGLTSTTTFYLEPYSSVCKDTMRHPLQIDILQIGTLSGLTGDDICANNTAELLGTTDVGIVTWSTSRDMNPLLGSGSPFTTAVLNVSEVFYVQSANQQCVGNVDSVEVNVKPNPNSTFNYQVNNPGDFRFIANASGVTYSWDFGDGNTGTTKAVNHLYEFNGKYDVTLTTTGSNGCISTTTLRVTAAGLPAAIQNVEFRPIEVYPNPSTGRITIQNPNGNGSFAVRNMLGQLLISDELTTGKTTVDLTDVKDGLYFIEVIHNDFVTSKKIVISK